MRILCISDDVAPQLENAAHLRRRHNDVDLIISCGDLPASYMEFISTVLSVPLFYVRGNHDITYDTRPPGGENLHGRIVSYRGLTFAGLEGSIRYNNGPIQYSDSEMLGKVLGVGPRLSLRRLRHKPGVDLLVTHAPPRGIHDLPDLAHTGFTAFLRFMEWYRPRYLIHGHVHMYDRRQAASTQYLDTRVLNVYPMLVLDIEPEKTGAPEGQGDEQSR